MLGLNLFLHVVTMIILRKGGHIICALYAHCCHSCIKIMSGSGVHRFYVTTIYPRCIAVGLTPILLSCVIEFYRKLGFQELARIPEYYHIQNTPADALLYHRCVNGGEPFSGSVHSYLRRYVAENIICSLLLYCCAQLYLVFVGVWRRRNCRWSLFIYYCPIIIIIIAVDDHYLNCPIIIIIIALLWCCTWQITMLVLEL